MVHAKKGRSAKNAKSKSTIFLLVSKIV